MSGVCQKLPRDLTDYIILYASQVYVLLYWEPLVKVVIATLVGSVPFDAMRHHFWIMVEDDPVHPDFWWSTFPLITLSM